MIFGLNSIAPTEASITRHTISVISISGISLFLILFSKLMTTSSLALGLGPSSGRGYTRETQSQPDQQSFFAAHEVKLPTCFCNKSPGSALIRRRRLLPIFGCLPPHDGPRRKATRRERNEMPSSSSLASPRPSIRPVPVLPCYAHLRP